MTKSLMTKYQLTDKAFKGLVNKQIERIEEIPTLIEESKSLECNYKQQLWFHYDSKKHCVTAEVVNGFIDHITHHLKILRAKQYTFNYFNKTGIEKKQILPDEIINDVNHIFDLLCKPFEKLLSSMQEVAKCTVLEDCYVLIKSSVDLYWDSWNRNEFSEPASLMNSTLERAHNLKATI